MHYQKICVLGLGYIGLPTASTFATQGLKVVGVDINPQVVETLRNGGLHIHEPGLRTLVQAALAVLIVYVPELWLALPAMAGCHVNADLAAIAGNVVGDRMGDHLTI